MSDDLISRKSLIKNLNKFAPEYYSALVNDLIAKEPTTFDKEKVINDLLNASICPSPDEDSFVELEEAIEIVEKGGIE